MQPVLGSIATPMQEFSFMIDRHVVRLNYTYDGAQWSPPEYSPRFNVLEVCIGPEFCRTDGVRLSDLYLRDLHRDRFL